MKTTTVNVGGSRALAIGAHQVASAIGKPAVTGPVAVRPLGLAGDKPADLSVHGGLAKALYAYPAEHDGFRSTERAQAGVARWGGEALAPGSLGEKLTLEGLLETSGWIGDALRIPDGALAIRQVRIDDLFRARVPRTRVGA
jgi:MOSC domain-containing protein YiiM